MKYEGIINILKPPGLSSSDVVTDVRRALSMKRVGHLGTLDPGAAGVLPVALGRATRLFDYLIDKEKVYVAELTFGKATDTLDSYGRVTAEDSLANVTHESFVSVLPQFIGEIEQYAPMYSAVSINGTRLYNLARSGKDEVKISRRVTVHSIDLLEMPRRNSFLIRVRCSKGTYIRTLCNDIAAALGTVAYLSFLLRTVSGSFTLDSAVSIAELNKLAQKDAVIPHIIPADVAVSFLPELRLTGDCDIRRKLVCGASVRLDDVPEATPYRVYFSGEFLGIGIVEGVELHIKTRFTAEGSDS